MTMKNRCADMLTEDEELTRLRDIAKRFRAAIEKSNKGSLPISFAKFPLGSCGDAVPLLGTYLLTNEYGEFWYADAERGEVSSGNWCSHAWLQKGTLLIDITADQFPEINEKVIVSLDSEWHKQFSCSVSRLADYRRYHGHVGGTLHNSYREIMKHM
jgi:hypothetical protein